MTEKRANNGLWKIEVDEDEKTSDRLATVLDHYKRLARIDPPTYPRLHKIELVQPADGVELTLYLRIRRGLGIRPFVEPYLANETDRKKFWSTSVDACLFIDSGDTLFAVTTGAGYRVIEDHVDYAFPFDTAKRLIANNFRAADIRSFTGATTSRTETYRRNQSIQSSESFGKVWKRLVGRLNSDLLPDDSYLKRLIDPNKPPAIEVKSSLVLRKSLDLRQLVSLAREIERLPDPSDEQLRELSFLDSLYQVKGSTLKAELKETFVENLRLAVIGASEFDFDVCDPDDITQYYSGTDFKLERWSLPGDPPDSDHVVRTLRENLSGHLGDPLLFAEKLDSIHLHYATSPDADAPRERKELYKFLHGQADFDGQTYFLLDKIWYRIQGDFLANLKKDFIQEVFSGASPILIGSELPLTVWNDKDEGAFNERQSKEDGFYFGDRIFAKSNRGKVELFDLLRVDEENEVVYLMHVKDGFDAKMRDACSQISVSGDVIRQDIATGLSVVKNYYQEWQQHSLNVGKRVSQSRFVEWFTKFKIIYVVVVSTATDFTSEAFESNALHSHIARREVLATRNEFKSHADEFRIAHTRRVVPA